MTIDKKFLLYLDENFDWTRDFSFDDISNAWRVNSSYYDEWRENSFYSELEDWIGEGANINIDNGKFLNSAIDYRAIKVVQILVYAGINLFLDSSVTPFVRVFNSHPSFHELGHEQFKKYNDLTLEIAKLLWEKGFGLPIEIDNIPPNITFTDILIYASAIGDEDLVEELIKRGVDLNATNAYGYSALHFAILYEREAIVSKLLDRGANPNLSSEFLYNAIKFENTNIVRLLLNAGADPNVSSEFIYNAIKLRNKDIIHLLLDAGTEHSQTYGQIVDFTRRKQNIEILEFLLLDQKIDPNLIEFDHIVISHDWLGTPRMETQQITFSEFSQIHYVHENIIYILLQAGLKPDSTLLYRSLDEYSFKNMEFMLNNFPELTLRLDLHVDLSKLEFNFFGNNDAYFHFKPQFERLHIEAPELVQEIVYRELVYYLQNNRLNDLMYFAAFIEKIFKSDPLELLLKNSDHTFLLIELLGEIKHNSPFIDQALRVQNKIMLKQLLDINHLNYRANQPYDNFCDESKEEYPRVSISSVFSQVLK